MLLMIVISLVTLQSQVRCDIICLTCDLPPIDQYCHGVCANLYFYDVNDVLLHAVQGTDDRIKNGYGVKGVAKVQTVGHHGCYTIFKYTNFTSTNHCWKHMDRLNLMESEYGYTRVRSVKYDPDCNCSSQKPEVPVAFSYQPTTSTAGDALNSLQVKAATTNTTTTTTTTTTTISTTTTTEVPAPVEKVPCDHDIVSFDGNGFYEFRDKLINKNKGVTIEIEVHLTTKFGDGVIIWKRSDRYKDFISLGLQDGRVRLDYHYSKINRTVTVVSEETINDGRNHIVKVIKQRGGDSILQIDDNDGKEGKAGLDSVGKDQINTRKGALYLGGLPLGANVEETTLGLYTNGFVGCVTYISFINTFGTVTEMNSQAKNF